MLISKEGWIDILKIMHASIHTQRSNFPTSGLERNIFKFNHESFVGSDKFGLHFIDAVLNEIFNLSGEIVWVRF